MHRRLIRLVRTAFPKRVAAEQFNDQGVDLAERGLHTSAVSCFERAIDANPPLGEAWSNLASCLDLLGQPEEACEAYATAESCGYKTAFLYDNWGNALSHRECLSEAEQKYRQALNLDETLSEAKANLGLTLISMGRIEEG